jgi:hypothetical protein
MKAEKKMLDLKNIVEEGLFSYETKIENISCLFDAAHLIFADFPESIVDTKEEREKINFQLRDILAKNEHLRRKDFDKMMRGILLRQEQREKDVRNLLKDYVNGQKTMGQALRENLGNFKDSLAAGEAVRVKEFRELIKDISAGQEKRKDDIISKLKEFQNEQETLSKRLKALLSKGRELRIKDLKTMLKEFGIQREKRLANQRKRKEELSKMLGRGPEGRKEKWD